VHNSRLIILVIIQSTNLSWSASFLHSSFSFPNRLDLLGLSSPLENKTKSQQSLSWLAFQAFSKISWKFWIVTLIIFLVGTISWSLWILPPLPGAFGEFTVIAWAISGHARMHFFSFLQHFDQFTSPCNLPWSSTSIWVPFQAYPWNSTLDWVSFL